jgi:hypothetical protein
MPKDQPAPTRKESPTGPARNPNAPARDNKKSRHGGGCGC